jgi:uncharacterized protein
MVFDVVIGRSKKDVMKYGKQGTVLIGKQYVKMGQTTSLSNPVYLDVAGAHIVFIVGKRGSGKCLYGETLITLNDGSQVKIKDLENDKNAIFTLDQNYKIKQGKKSHFYKRSVNRLLEIKLRTGKTIKLTPEHPLLTIKGWSPAEKLNLGARIATPRKVDAFGENSQKECNVKLLAYLIAEGHLGNGFVLFSNFDKKIVEDFGAAVKNFDDGLIIKTHSSEGCFRVIQNISRSTESAKHDEQGRFIKSSKFEQKSSLRKWLEEKDLYGTGSLTKFIPDDVFNLPKHQLSLFLNRLFSCDGTIYLKSGHWFISYCSSSNRLIHQVQHLLLRFGVVSRIRKKIISNKFESNEIEIYGEGVNQYLQEIGFYGKKEQRAATAIKESMRIIRNPNVDTVPREIWDIYRPNNWADVGRKIGYAHPKALRESIHYSPSRQKLLQIAKADESDLLSKFANSDVFWDEIVSLKYLEGNYQVYDLTVPETHNFVANDIVVHNSYTMGSIAEGLADLPTEIRQNLSIVLLDTMGIYWTMKYPNFKEADLLKKWGFSSKPLDVKIYTPSGFYYKYKEQGIPTDFPFSLRPIDVSANDWCNAFGLKINSAEGVLITRVVQHFNRKGDSYDLEEVMAFVRGDKESDKVTKGVIINEFDKAIGWQIFSKEGTTIKEIVAPGQVTVLDVSPYATMDSGWEIKALVVGLISRILFQQRMLARKTEEFKSVDAAMHYFSKEEEQKMKEPLVWIAIDEAHEMLPHDGKTAASDALITILREGRQPGISLILATQQPAKIHTDVMTQSDTVIAHRLTAKMDTEALGLLMQSYMRQGMDKEINLLPRLKGAAVLFDDANERLFPVQMRPRFTWHGGGSPSAIREKKNDFDKELKEIEDLE